MARDLATELVRFQKWLDQAEVAKAPDWEIEYPDWTAIYDSFEACLADFPRSVTKEKLASMVRAIALDHESEHLLEVLADRVEWLRPVAYSILGSTETDAKWQLAQLLGRQVLPAAESEAMLLVLILDDNEYVRRIALEALGRIDSSYAEHFSTIAWASEHEYQRIMALWVLNTIESPALPHYIELGLRDASPHVVRAAQEIQGMSSGL